MIALKSIEKGVNKLLLNQHELNIDLNNNWAVVAEAIQTILRRDGYPKPYEKLKELTRKNTEINAESIANFIDNLNLDKKTKEELKSITPNNYTGI